MTDQEKRENVIKGLESLKKRLYNNKNILDGGIVGNALALLKAQEAVNPNMIMLGNMVMYYQCPVCLATIDNGNKFCPNCGRAVRWE